MIEKTIRDKSADERRAVRQGNSKPLVLALKTWLELQLARVSTKSVIAEVIRYGLNHWDGLVRFLDDGRIELDTNIVEPIVLNQKNALFAGHDQGRRTGQPSPHSSRPANCTASIRKPTSPTCSPNSSISGQPRASRSSCLWRGQNSVPPIAERHNHECGSGRARSAEKLKPSEQWDWKIAYFASVNNSAINAPLRSLTSPRQD